MKKVLVISIALAVALLGLSGCAQRSGISLREVANELEKLDTGSTVPTPTPTATVQKNDQVTFASNGDLISGWYWLRDSALKQYAEWTVKDVPATGSLIEVNVEALATNKASGGRGYDAKFTVYYGLPSNKDNPNMLEKQVITLPNTSPDTDPVGYTCTGKFYVPHLLIGQNDELYIKVVRGAASDNHVAFNQGSIVSLQSAEGDTTTR